MTTLLDIVAAWIALDLVLIAGWHLAHVHSRRLSPRVVSPGPVTQRVYTLAPEARLRDAHPNLVPAGRG
jgi:hypothetical protein